MYVILRECIAYYVKAPYLRNEKFNFIKRGIKLFYFGCDQKVF